MRDNLHHPASGEPAAVGETDPERMLACAVLERAVMDLACTDHNATRRANQKFAKIFLTAERGPWARTRKFWLDLAGIDPEAFAQGIKVHLS